MLETLPSSAPPDFLGCNLCRNLPSLPRTLAGRKFAKGEVRFVLTAGDPQKKSYLSLSAAGAELAPVIAQVGCRLGPLPALAPLLWVGYARECSAAACLPCPKR